MKNNESSTRGRKSILKSKAGISVLSVGLMFLGANMYLGGENSNYYNKSKSMAAISRNVVLTASATQYGITTASSLSVRSGAGTRYSVVSSMKKGTKVIMTGKTNNFYRITYGGKTRYISAQYVKITTKPAVVKPPVVKPPVVAPYKTQYGVITASSLSVRSGAGTKYSVVSSMKKGTKVIMTGKINNFYRITYGGKTRYVSAQYVKITTKPAVVKPPVVMAPQKYVSNKLGLSVTFPVSWKNKYTVEEDNNGLIVRFKPVGNIKKGEGLLFVIVKRSPSRDEGMLDTIGKRYVTAKGVAFVIGGPTDVGFPTGNPEYSSYKKLVSELSSVALTIKSIN